jgi:hypothetical protein
MQLLARIFGPTVLNGSLEDIFELQDKVAISGSGARALEEASL